MPRKPKSSRKPKKLLLHLLLHVGRLVGDELRARLEAHGITHGQARMLDALTMHDGVNQATLAEALHIKPPTASRMLATMAENGLITRSPDAKDARVQRVTLTRAGRKAAKHVEVAWDETEARLRALVTRTEEKELHELMLTVRDGLHGQSPDWEALAEDAPES